MGPKMGISQQHKSMASLITHASTFITFINYIFIILCFSKATYLTIWMFTWLHIINNTLNKTSCQRSHAWHFQVNENFP